MIIVQWFILTLAILATAYFLEGIKINHAFTAVLVAAVLSIVNTVVRPVLLFITLPITIVTLGLFALVINALLILLVARIVPGFTVRGFWWALAFSVLVSFINWILSAAFSV